MSRSFRFAEGEFYHIYNRGTEKREIFMKEIDWKRFQLLLYICNQKSVVNLRLIFESGTTFSKLYEEVRSERLVDIGAYCQMPNHFHILVRERVEGGTSLFMRKLGTAYTMSFNNKYNHSGSLFEGRYKAKHVDSDAYLQYLFGYIHLNPVKLIEPNWKNVGKKELLKTKTYLNQYPYSSYLDYMGVKRSEGAILNTEYYPAFFKKTANFETFINDFLTPTP